MKSGIRQHSIAIIIMVFLALGMSYPVVLHMQDSIIGQGGDPWQTMWRFEHKATGGVREFWNDISGSGEPRLANLSVWPWMPIHAVFGEPLGYNLIWILITILSGYAMALLVQLLTGSKTILASASLLAGIAYMFLPYRMAHAFGHFGAMQMQWIPFIALVVIHYLKKPALWKVILFGILYAIQAWTEHHYALWLFIFAILALLVYRKEIREWISSYRNVLIHGIIVLLLLVFGVFVPYIPTIKLAASPDDTLSLGTEQTVRFSADLFSFITPSPQHPLWGRFSDALFAQFFTGNDAESVEYLGISILLVILFFHRHIPIRQKRLWIWTIIVFGVISLGPVLHLFGRETGIPLPYALLAKLPVFSSVRVVARAGSIVGFATCVLFGWALATNIHRKRTAGIGAIVILLEFLFIPFPIQSAQLSPAYAALKDAQGSRIIEIPTATNYTAASRSLYASLLHGKELVGNISLERGASGEDLELARSLPAVRQILYLRTTDLMEKRSEFFGQDIAETLPDVMNHLDARAILVHTDSLSDTQFRALDTFFSGMPSFSKTSFSDAQLYIFDPARATSDGVFLIRGDGFEHVGYDPKRQSVFAQVPSVAHVRIVNTNDRPVSVHLTYPLAPESTSRVIVKDAQGREITGSILLSPGSTDVTFTVVGDTPAILQNPQLIYEDSSR
jgi:hypothetical protein